jgi:hypothetical protein
MYAHSSTVLHANTCYVDPDIQHLSIAIHTSLAEAQAGMAKDLKGTLKNLMMLHIVNLIPVCAQFESLPFLN